MVVVVVFPDGFPLIYTLDVLLAGTFIAGPFLPPRRLAWPLPSKAAGSCGARARGAFGGWVCVVFGRADEEEEEWTRLRL